METSSLPVPWLSIIIPTLNEVDTLPSCLQEVYTGATEGAFEVVLADGGSTDGTLELASTYPALTVVHSTRGRARQLNAGALQARGRFFWFLHADTRPPNGWFKLLQHVATTGQAATFRVHFSGQEYQPLLRCYARGSWINHWAVRFGDQSLFIAKDQFNALNGYREDHALMEGHDLARRIMKTGTLTLLPASVTTSSRRYQRFGVVYTQAIFTLIFSLYYLGASQQLLVAIYRRAFRKR